MERKKEQEEEEWGRKGEKEKKFSSWKRREFWKENKNKRIPIIMSLTFSYFLVFTIVIPLISDYFNLSSSLVLKQMFNRFVVNNLYFYLPSSFQFFLSLWGYSAHSTAFSSAIYCWHHVKFLTFTSPPSAVRITLISQKWGLVSMSFYFAPLNTLAS